MTSGGRESEVDFAWALLDWTCESYKSYKSIVRGAPGNLSASPMLARWDQATRYSSFYRICRSSNL